MEKIEYRYKLTYTVSLFNTCIHNVYIQYIDSSHFIFISILLGSWLDLESCTTVINCGHQETEAGNPNPTRFWRPLGGNFRDFSASERKHVPWRMNTMVAPDDRERGEVEVDLKTLNIGWVVVWFGTGSDW